MVMIAKVKSKIRNYIINKLVNMVSEIKIRFKEKEFGKVKDSLKHIGHDVLIEYPYQISGAPYISIGDNFKALRHFRLEAIPQYAGDNFSPVIIIGNDVSIESNCHIGAINEVIIGDGVMIASNVYIADHFHGDITKNDLSIPPARRRLSSKGSVIINNNVWIGDSVCILPGVTIGKNSIVGSNAVVTKDVPANSVVAGVPAVIIKQF
jgi:acetyltransferase-like isoleucine patch superfamily enzyme